MLTITLLGTAATMPLPERALTAAVAECGGHSLLLDCGEGTQTAARRAGVNLMRADAICLTHYHGDHIFGLPGLLQTLGAQGADLLLCDATYALPEQQEQAAQWGHSTFGQSAALAEKAGAKRLWLVHYSPMITDPEQQLAQAQSIFPAAECGFDGKRITLHYEENEE